MKKNRTLSFILIFLLIAFITTMSMCDFLYPYDSTLKWREYSYGCFVVMSMTAIFTTVGCFVVGNSDSYAEGQKDALLNGNHYKLIEFPNGEREVYYEPKPEDFEGDKKNFIIIK